MDHSSLIRLQRAFFQSGATRRVAFRREQLRKLISAVERHEQPLCEALHADLRRSAYAAYTTEIGMVLAEARHALRHVGKWARAGRRSIPWMAWPARAQVQREPFGVAAILGPWNYPVQLILSPLVAAMAAGNCVILKPSEFAPRTSAAVAALIEETFAREYVAVVEGGQAVAESLLAEKLDFVFFTGGSAVGRLVMAAAARQLTPVALELGGKCPAIVCADAALDVAARRIAWAKFMNAGQTCVAPDFVLVQRPVRERLIAELGKAIEAFYGEAPQRSAEYGRMVNRRHFERVVAYLGDGAVAHGGGHDGDDLYIAPTILTGVAREAPVMREEIFGPVLPVLEFDGLEEAVALLRERPAPLAVYAFTRDRGAQQRVIDGTRSGGVCINDVMLHMTNSSLPFGGVGESGFGAYHGEAGFDCFSHARAIMRRPAGMDSAFRYPPAKTSLATIRRLYGWLMRS